MKNYKKHIDDFFREKLGNYKETPPPEVWNNLETRLASLATGSGFHFSYRWLSHFAIVSVILFFGASLVKKMTGASIENISLNEKAIAQTPLIKPGQNPMTNKSQALQPVALPAVSESSTPDEPNTTTDQATVAVATNKNGNALNNGRQAGKNAIARKQGSSSMINAIKAKLAKEPQHETVYASNTAKPGPAEETNDSYQALVLNAGKSSAGMKKEADPTENKVKLPSEISNKEDDVVPSPGKPSAHRFEAGIKLGYERGFDNFAATKYVAAPYLQYNLSSRLSVLVQPAFKSAAVNTRAVGKPQSYYKENNDSTVTLVGDVIKNYLVEGGTRADSQYTTTYNYSQTHDSIVKTYSFGGTFIEFELPILLKYAVTHNLSVYGGVNINYSKLVGLTESSTTVQGIKISVDSTNTSTGAPAHLPLGSVITYHGTPVSDYHAVATPGGMLRVGYTVGFSYEYSDRWLFDGMMQQTPVRPDVQHGYNVNTTVSAPYFRLSIGYKIIK